MQSYQRIELKQFFTLPSTRILVVLFAFLIVGCSPTRKLSDNELLLNKVKLKSDEKLKDISRDDLLLFAKQKPNRRLFWVFKFHLWWYNLYKRDSEAKLKEAIGEAPVIYDSVATQNSVRQLHLYLRNKGFYHNEVTYEEKIKRKKVNITYSISYNQPHVIKKKSISTDHKWIQKILIEDSVDSQIKDGARFDLDMLDNERERLARVLQNKGYFMIDKDKFVFQCDTLQQKDRVNIDIQIPELDTVSSSGLPVEPPQAVGSAYKIRNIFVTTNYDPGQLTNAKDTVYHNNIAFLLDEDPLYKKRAISQAILFSVGDYYSATKHENTYRRLSGLKNFKYINISYEAVEDSGEYYLDCAIRLSPITRRSVSIESNLTNTGGNLGIGGNLAYQDKNIFKGAEILKLRVNGSVEAQHINTTDDGEVISNTPFNTIEFGPTLSLDVPMFLLPFKTKSFSKGNKPQTSISTSLNFQSRPDYQRSIANASIGYSWYETARKRHIIEPLNLSTIDITNSESFQKQLDELENSSLKYQYSDHFILASSYAFIYSNQTFAKKQDYQYLRTRIEPAGNLMFLFDQLLLDSPTDEDGAFTVNGIRYAQYMKGEVEFKNYKLFNWSSLVWRLMSGVGWPYGNVNVMPFEKSFFGGGSNGIRAWQLRSLGPGHLSKYEGENIGIDQIGDIKLETNLEYRFTITKVLEGAGFIDAGNIWLLNEDPDRPGAKFEVDNLWRDLAIGSGLGMRLNFNFFVIRLDAAYRVKDPGSEDPFELKFFHSNVPLWNFGIGYPF